MVGLGYHQEDHWALTYAGSWQEVEDDRAVLGRYRVADSAGDALSFTFLGTDLSLMPVCEASPLMVEVTIDRRGSRQELCTADASHGEEVPLVGGLAHGRHEVQLTLVDQGDGAGQLAIDGLIVRHTPLFIVRRGLSLLTLPLLSLLILCLVFRARARRGVQC
jgi:hypothetical protein